MRTLHIRIDAKVTGEPSRVLSVSLTIPPDYDDQDIAALTARKIEDAAFALNRREFHRAPTRDALIALAARLTALEALKDALAPSPLRDQIEAIFNLTNDEATAQYGVDPDGP